MPTFWRGVASGFEEGVLDMARIAGLSPEEGHRVRGRPTRIRDDLDIPVMIVNSESETLLQAAVRQPDTERFRFWEVAGASHFPRSLITPLARFLRRDFGIDWPAAATPACQSHVTWEAVLESAMLQFAQWIDQGIAPAMIAPIELTTPPLSIVRDQHGLARGGVRLPDLEAPIALNDGSANGLNGIHEPFSPGKLASLYPSHQTYVQRVEQAALQASQLGVITPDEALRYVKAAMAANVPPDWSA